MNQNVPGFCRKCAGKLLRPEYEGKRYGYCDRCPYGEKTLNEEAEKVKKYSNPDRELM